MCFGLDAGRHGGTSEANQWLKSDSPNVDGGDSEARKDIIVKIKNI